MVVMQTGTMAWSRQLLVFSEKIGVTGIPNENGGSNEWMVDALLVIRAATKLSYS